MKIAVTGHRGKLGSLLIKRDGFVPFDCNILDPDSIDKSTQEIKPDLIVHLAGIASIDVCEENYQKAINVNVHGTYNLYKIFGQNILTISTDQIFDGKKTSYKEKDKPNPINSYGMTKLGQEAVVSLFGGKVLRLSRTVSMNDIDILNYLKMRESRDNIFVPSFIYRNYLHRQQAVDGIVYACDQFETLPNIVHYGGKDNVSYYHLISDLFLKLPYVKVYPRREEVKASPRPMMGGFSVRLAQKLGFPMYSLGDTVSELVREFHA